jgi:hypothetical protein
MRVQRVGILSCALVSAVLGTLYGLFFGLSVYLTSMVPAEPGRGAVVQPAARPGAARGSQDTFGELGVAVTVLILLLVSPVAGVIGGFIGGALLALIYNATVGLTGGLELDLREPPGGRARRTGNHAEGTRSHPGRLARVRGNCPHRAVAICLRAKRPVRQ